MRNTVVAACLWLITSIGSVAAFDIETQQLFDATETERKRLSILSTADLEFFMPLIEAFQQRLRDVAVSYTQASSVELYRAIAEESAPFDVVISSAMDLQMKLANDGFARSHRSAATTALPQWARWRDELFAITQEPVTLLVSRDGFAGLTIPRTRQQLIELLRNYPERFRGRVGTYDLRVSGAGYLFATQDARQSDTFWRLAEVLGSLQPRLYCCSSDMIQDVATGRLLLAYNVLGSYALAGDRNDDGQVVVLEDFTNVLLRSVMIPMSAPRPELGAQYIDYLLGEEGQRLLMHEAGLSLVSHGTPATDQHLRPIRLGPGLLVYLDGIKRERFLREWADAVLRE